MKIIHNPDLCRCWRERTHDDPYYFCGECERVWEERAEAYERQQYQIELDGAFHEMCDALNAGVA